MIATTACPSNDYDQDDLDLDALQECIEPARSLWGWAWAVLAWMAA